MHMKKTLNELPSLFFSMRQIIRSQFPDCKHDQNAWLRFETMRFIAENGGPTMQDLARYLHIQAPSATSLIAHLISHSSVRRIAEKKDKRVVRLYLTSRGKKQLVVHYRRSRGVMKKTFSEFSRDDLQQLVRILRRLRSIHEQGVHAEK
jgi:DNA-binding MarR family transcriptional regulator